MSDPRDALGRRGERLAEKHLRHLGMRCLFRRYATPAGEIDLVMRHGDTIVFAEVKTRRDTRFDEPEHAVNTTKQRKMARAARAFLADRKLRDAPCRFDVVSVVLPEKGAPTVRHFPDAFPPQRGG